MSSILLRHKKLPVAKQSRENNIENGNDAEVYSASILLKAIGAEISWSSRNEDGRKIDLICSYDNPWVSKERIIFFVQVKSGDSYGRLNQSGFTLLTAAKKAAQRTSHSICIIWVDRNSNSTYWAYIHPFSTKLTQDYSNYHKITPATKFDIARCQSRSIPGKENGSGIIIRALNGSIKSKREYALKHYKRLKSKEIINPNLGKIEFTRIGWRHMFRKQRTLTNKEKSIQVIPYLDIILENKPTKIYITKFDQEIIQNFEYRICEYVLTYDEVKVNINGIVETKTVIIRLLEEIRWPNNWQNNSMLSQLVDRKIVLLNSYYK